MLASYFEGFLRNSGHNLRIKGVIWQSCWRLSSPDILGPMRVLPAPVWWKGSCCQLPIHSCKQQTAYSRGLIIDLGSPKELPNLCPQFTGQVTGVPPPVTVSLTLARSLFNVISLLSDNLTKAMEHLFNMC